jgi:hypothetical protein
VLATALHEKIPIIFEIFEHHIISDNLKNLIRRTVISDKLSAMSFSFQFPSIFQKEVMILL